MHGLGFDRLLSSSSGRWKRRLQRQQLTLLPKRRSTASAPLRRPGQVKHREYRKRAHTRSGASAIKIIIQLSLSFQFERHKTHKNASPQIKQTHKNNRITNARKIRLNVSKSRQLKGIKMSRMNSNRERWESTKIARFYGFCAVLLICSIF